MADFKIPHPRLQNFKMILIFRSRFRRIRDFDAGGHAYHRLALVSRGGLSECFLYYPCDKIEDGGPLWYRLFHHFLFEPFPGRENVRSGSCLRFREMPSRRLRGRWKTRRLQVLILVASILLSIFAASSGSGQWENFLLLTNATSFGIADPLFNKDVSFYIFSLPLLTHVYSCGHVYTRHLHRGNSIHISHPPLLPLRSAQNLAGLRRRQGSTSPYLWLFSSSGGHSASGWS